MHGIIGHRNQLDKPIIPTNIRHRIIFRGGYTMRELAKKYLDEIQADGKSEKTVIAYQCVLNQFIKWLEDTNGNSNAENVVCRDAKDFKVYLMNIQRFKPATVNKAIVVLKGFFTWAAENGFMQVNPARKIKLVEKEQAAPKWLEKTEQSKLLREIEKEKNTFNLSRNKAITLMMLAVGLRVEEVADLELDDISVNSRSGNVIVRQGKRDKYREIPLNKDIRESLKAYLDKRKSHKFAGSEFLFLSERADRMTTRAIQHMIEGYAYQSRIEGLTCHTLRHTFCHNLVAAGERLDIVAELAGHKTIDTTRIYTMPSNKEKQAAVERIAEGD